MPALNNDAQYPQRAAEAFTTKKEYTPPTLTYHGSVTQITLKVRNLQDHNNGNNNQGTLPAGDIS